MNYKRAASAALAGLRPRQADRRIRMLQSKFILALFSHQPNYDSQEVRDIEWRSLAIKRK